jgi:hypothetical protein
MTDDRDRVERLLARGNPSGPRLDRLWDGIAPQVVTRRGWLQGWRKTGLAGLLALVPVAAGLVLYLGQPSGFVARGGSRNAPPALEATCGSDAAPCRVGLPVYLRLAARGDGGVVYVRLRGPGAADRVLAGPLSPSATDAVPVPVRLVPEAVDVETGLDLEAVWRERPLQAGDAPTALDDVTVGSRSRLHLRVAP